jgi:hypothetical protein
LTFREILDATPRDRSFGNGRFARNVLEAAIGRHAWRLRDVTAPTKDQLRQILAEDLTDEPEPTDEPESTVEAEPTVGPEDEDQSEQGEKA